MKRILALSLSMMLSACAPLAVQRPARPDLTFQGPSLDPGAFVSFDGVRLGLSTWEAKGEPWAVIIGVHGMNDYANAFHLAAPWWAEQGVTTIAYDQRGFGRSPGRGVWAGEDLMVEDLRTMVALARAKYPHAILAVAGESMGGAVTIAAATSDRLLQVDRIVLLSPAVWGWSTQPLRLQGRPLGRGPLRWVQDLGAAPLAHHQGLTDGQSRGIDRYGARPPDGLGGQGGHALWPGGADGNRLDADRPPAGASHRFSMAPMTRSSRRRRHSRPPGDWAPRSARPTTPMAGI